MDHISGIVDPFFFSSSIRLAYSKDIHPIRAASRHGQLRIHSEESKVLPHELRKPVEDLSAKGYHHMESLTSSNQGLLNARSATI